MKSLVIRYKRNNEVVDDKTLEKYIFPISFTPLISEFKKLAEFQKEISEKYYKEMIEIEIESSSIIDWIITHYEVPDK